MMPRFVWGRRTVAVDTHVFRVARRLGLAAGRAEAQVAPALETRIPECHRWGARVRLLERGKEPCRPRPRCAACFLADLYPRNGVAASVSAA
jgi:endonuclease-3